MRVRILAAEYDMRRDNLAMLVKQFEVMDNRDEINLRRQQLVIGVIPPVCREDAELATLDDLLDLFLERRKVFGRRVREILRIRFRIETRGTGERQAHGQKRRLQLRRSGRIGRQSLDRAHRRQIGRASCRERV